MSYHQARKIILHDGWKPAENMPAYQEIGALAHYFRDLGYDEVYDCTGASMARCIFYFQNEKGKYLRIDTAGEYNDPDYDLQTRIVSVSTLDAQF